MKKTLEEWRNIFENIKNLDDEEREEFGDSVEVVWLETDDEWALVYGYECFEDEFTTEEEAMNRLSEIERMVVKEMKEVTISVSALFEKIGQKTKYNEIKVDGDYFDLRNDAFGIVCMDGEICYIEKEENDLFYLINKNGETETKFILTKEEMDCAVFTKQLMKKYPFIELLKSKNLVSDYDFLKVREHIKFNNGINLSIQASESHYCNPKETLEDLDDYNSFEFMVFSNEENVYIPESLNRHSDGYGLFGFVPKEEIHKLVEEYVKRYGFENPSDLEFYKSVSK